MVIFDVLVFSKELEKSSGYTRNVIIANMNHDEYIYEQAYQNKKYNKEFEVVVKRLKHTVMNAYSMNWPYISFSGIENELTILNAIDQDVIHRIPIDKDGVKICTTYITDTRDLFVLAFKYKESKYYIYQLDLDQCSKYENDDQDEIDKAYKCKETFTYNETNVES